MIVAEYGMYEQYVNYKKELEDIMEELLDSGDEMVIPFGPIMFKTVMDITRWIKQRKKI